MCPGNRFEEKIVNRKKLLAQDMRFVYKPHLAQGQGLAFVQRPSVPGALPGVPAVSLAGAFLLPFQAPRPLEASCPKLRAWPFPGLSLASPALSLPLSVPPSCGVLPAEKKRPAGVGTSGPRLFNS